MADKYIERKRRILPVSYREKKEKRAGQRKNGMKTIAIITKLENKLELQSKAIAHLLYTKRFAQKRYCRSYRFNLTFCS